MCIQMVLGALSSGGDARICRGPSVFGGSVLSEADREHGRAQSTDRADRYTLEKTVAIRYIHHMWSHTTFGHPNCSTL